MKSSLAEKPHVSPGGQEGPAPLRVLAVTAERGGAATGLAPLHNMARWAEEAGVELEFVPELPQAVRQLAKAHWDAVLAFVSDKAEEALTWWKDVLRGAPGSPRLLAVVGSPSMGLVLRAERLGVLDLLSPPLRRE